VTRFENISGVQRGRTMGALLAGLHERAPFIVLNLRFDSMGAHGAIDFAGFHWLSSCVGSGHVRVPPAGIDAIRGERDPEIFGAG
jgi:hypothetical protein